MTAVEPPPPIGAATVLPLDPSPGHGHTIPRIALSASGRWLVIAGDDLKRLSAQGIEPEQLCRPEPH